eukprot:6188012-Pleurochrysis_carterae.AAC.1
MRRTASRHVSSQRTQNDFELIFMPEQVKIQARGGRKWDGASACTHADPAQAVPREFSVAINPHNYMNPCEAHIHATT